MHIHLTLNSSGSKNDHLTISCHNSQSCAEFATPPESESNQTVKYAKTIFILLLIIKNVGGFSQADIARVIQQVHDNVLSSDKKFDTKLQKDTFNDICAESNRIAQKRGLNAEWFTKKKIYPLLMAK